MTGATGALFCNCNFGTGGNEAGHCFHLLFFSFYDFCFSPTLGILRKLVYLSITCVFSLLSMKIWGWNTSLSLLFFFGGGGLIFFFFMSCVWCWWWVCKPNLTLVQGFAWPNLSIFGPGGLHTHHPPPHKLLGHSQGTKEASFRYAVLSRSPQSSSPQSKSKLFTEAFRLVNQSYSLILLGYGC